jgi:APA family basic amino acid/polyamine antiporter
MLEGNCSVPVADRKHISEYTATAVGLGAIIGAGIFVLSGTAISLAGSDALIAFVIVGVIAILIGLELGELGSIMPNAKGGVYSYTFNAFGSELGFITGVITYFSFATAISAIALGFGAYLTSILNVSSSYQILFAMLIIVLLSGINLMGIKKAVKADSYLVAIKILVLLALIAFALYVVTFGGYFAPSNFSVSPAQSGIGALFAASIAIFFAYTGFQSISTFTSKVEGGSRGAAKAILLAIVVSMALYVAVAVSMILLFPASQFTITADPLATVLRHVAAPQWMLILVDVGALIATASATLAMILAASRMLYQMSSDGLLPRIFRKNNKNEDVALNGVVASGIVGIIMLFSGNIYTIAAISNFGLLFAYLMASLALLHFRRKKRMGAFKAPAYPYLSIVAILSILVLISGMPQAAVAIGVIMILSLIVVYYTFREAESKKVVRVRIFN